jgi:NADH:ubiquinone oxidoreductase subunit K
MVPLQHLLYLSVVLFAAGIVTIIIKRNTIMMLIGIELMLNASALNLIAFNQLFPQNINGQMFALFVIIVAVCETAVGLAIVLRVYQHYQSSIPDEISELKD